MPDADLHHRARRILLGTGGDAYLGCIRRLVHYNRAILATRTSQLSGSLESRPAFSHGWGHSTRALLIVILGLAAIAYIATLQFHFVYDDESLIVGNQLIQHWHYVPFYFHIGIGAHEAPGQAGNYYRPIVLFWFRLNDALFGLRPFGWHLTTVLMHLLATFLVFKLARRLSQKDDVALITALVFGLHPVHIEAVAWVSGVSEPLFVVLLISAFLCFLDWREGAPNARTYSLLLYALSIFSKETAVLMMPLVFAYAWLYPRMERAPVRKRFWSSLAPVLPYLGVTLIYLYCRRIALRGLFHSVALIDIVTNLLTIPSVLWFYVKLLFAPVGLSTFYDTTYVTSASLRAFWLPLLGVLVFAAALFFWWWKTRDRLVAFASVLLIVPLLPLMKLSVLPYGEIAHDRYLYTPSIGFAMLAAIAVVGISERILWRRFQIHERPQWRALLIVAPLAAVFLVLTISQSLYWSDNLLLYSRGATAAPHNSVALNNLANELERCHLYAQAIALYAKVLEQNPNFYLANYNLGYTSCESGQYQEGERFLLRAAALNPSDGATFYFLGKCQMKLGKLDAAEANLHRAIITDPRLLGPRYTLGLLLKQEGRYREALDYFRAELPKNPDDADARRQVQEVSGK